MLRLILPLLFVLMMPSTGALAAGPKLAVVAPLSGNLKLLGDQVRDGARLAADGKAELVEIDESCTEGSGAAIAEKIAASGAVAATGFLCIESLEDGLAALAEAKIPAITVSVRSGVLMQDALKNGWPVFRLAPSTDAEREKALDAIFTTWKDRSIALLDDGTIISRELIDNLRQGLEQKGMKPAFIDNFRPAQEVQTQLIRRLLKANVTHVFAASDRNDMSVMARDAKALGADITFMGGDALRGSNMPLPLGPGVRAITLPEPASLASAKPVAELMRSANKQPEGYAIPSYSSVIILLAAAEISAGSGADLAQALVDTPFETPMGRIRFGKDHELADNPFRMLVWDGSEFVSPKETP